MYFELPSFCRVANFDAETSALTRETINSPCLQQSSNPGLAVGRTRFHFGIFRCVSKMSGYVR